MRKIILSILFFIFPAILFAQVSFKQPSVVLKDESTSQGKAASLNCVGAGVSCSVSGTDGTITVSGGGGSANAGGGRNAVQYNSDGTSLGGDETKFSFNTTNIGVGTINGNALFSINSTANQALFRIDDNGINDASPAIYVDAAGNVGVGTTSPISNLDIGGGRIGGELQIASAFPEMYFDETDQTGPAGQFGLYVNNDRLHFFRNAVFMVLENIAGNSAGGHLGIGTLNPQASIHVATTASADLFRIDDNGASDTTPDVIDQNGNFGIGTSTPQSKLVVLGGNVGIGTWTAGDAVNIFGGNVGINTISAPNRLYVAGTGEFQSIKLPGNGVAAGNVLVTGSTGIGTWMTPASIGITGGTVTSIATTSPISGGTITGSGTISIADSVADGLTKGAASFTAADFNSSSGNISLDYINGQAASSSNKGFLTSADWTTFNNKVSSETNTLTTETTGIADDQVPVGSSSNVAAYKTVPDCDDTSGNHLNYDTATNAFTCGNTGDGAGSGSPGGGLNAVQYNNGSTFAGSESVFSMNGTNVGVGTTNGTAKFDVRGNQLISGNIGIGGASATSVPLNVTGAGNISGNLGVGAANGGYTLDVLGTNRFRASTYNLYMNENTAPAGEFTTGFNVVGGNDGVNIAPATDIGTSGKKVVMAYFDGSAWKSALEYANASGNANLALLKSGGNVGINTSIPPSALYVAGTAQIRGLQLHANGAGSGKVLVSDSVGVGTWMSATTTPTPLTLTTTGSSGAATLTGNVLNVPQYSGGSSQWFTQTGTNGNVGIGTYDGVGIGTTKGNAALVILPTPQGANVGVGTWNPVADLEVIGTAKATALRATGISGSTQCVQADTNGNLSGTGSACGGAGSTPGGGQNAVQRNNSSAFSGNEAVFSFNGTNVGVGTTNGQGLVDISSTATGSLFQVQDNGPNDTSPFEIDGNGSVGIGTTLASPETKLAVMSGNVGIGTWAPIDALIVMGGNVGIGSFRPHSSLVIQSSANVTSFSGQSMQGNVAGNFGISNVNASASSAVNITGGAAVGSGLYLVSTSNASAAGVDFVQLKGNSSGATVLMTARGNGNIGIGTISPYAKLQIIGNIGIGTGQSSSFQGTVPPNGGMIVETNIGIGTVNPGTSLDVNGVLRISNAGDTYFQGNIGLGTTIPMNTLSVLGNVGIGSTKYGGNVCVGGQEVGNSGGLCVSHNVGIGTLIPTAALQIFQGTANVGIGTYTSGTALCWKNCHATTGRCELGYATGTLTGNIWSGCN